MKQKKTKVQDIGPILKIIWSQTAAEYRVKMLEMAKMSKVAQSFKLDNCTAPVFPSSHI